ncbi:MAG TPA: hypothetical protein VFC82_02815 [Actinomycetaceae bacterium]|nr:hypothetical protein [Actinomycetaceae bacterium]
MSQHDNPSDAAKEKEPAGSDQAELMNSLAGILKALNHPIAADHRPSGEAEKLLKKELNKRAVEAKPVTVAFPTCTDVMFSLVRTSSSDEIAGFFHDYFQFCDHQLLADAADLESVLDRGLRTCSGKWFQRITPSNCEGDVVITSRPGTSSSSEGTATTAAMPRATPGADWPPFWCFPPTCVSLRGRRHLYPDPDPAAPAPGKIKRLFAADLLWVFYVERLGIFQILGRILDDYAYIGALPISNGSLRPGAEDDVTAVVLEAMVRATEAGASSKVRDRNSSYQRALGWQSEAGRRLNQAGRSNQELTRYLHQFFGKVLRFYDDKRLAVAIRSTGSPAAQPSTETLTAISVTLVEMKKTFERFHYGRNYTNTLSAIVWAIAGMALIERLKEDLGIPRAYNSPHEFIPAAYNILVLENKDAPLETSRYENHKICAEAGRDILMDIELLDLTDVSIGGELDTWLSVIEGSVEKYRTAYRSLTGVDIGAASPAIEQQA